ncbi:hypothetical protein MBH78_15420 [Oceanimonas sp. NS1]|nr:hypothetical protein [Oceanimonas sp. NS1]
MSFHRGKNFPWCTYGGDDIKAVVVGDSHASSVMTAVLEAVRETSASPEQAGIYGSSYTSCPTLLGVQKFREDLKCAEFNEFIVNKLDSVPHDIPLIIVNRNSGALFGDQRITSPEQQSPSIYFDKPWNKTTSAFLKEYENNLVSTTCVLAEKRKVYLVNPFPEMPVDVPKVMARKTLLGKPSDIFISMDDYVKRHQFVMGVQNKVAVQCSNVAVLNSSHALCRNGICNGTENGYPLYYDDNHLTERGNRKLVGMFNEIFKGDRSLQRGLAKSDIN